MSMNWGDVSIFLVAEILKMKGLLQDSVSLVLDDERDSSWPQLVIITLKSVSHPILGLNWAGLIGPSIYIIDEWTDQITRENISSYVAGGNQVWGPVSISILTWQHHDQSRLPHYIICFTLRLSLSFSLEQQWLRLVLPLQLRRPSPNTGLRFIHRTARTSLFSTPSRIRPIHGAEVED